ncbi:uncharacterized protein BDR25DRAFT_355998 [Lindgomyces ingoldianus]|uniref:Uncharacterized protein n=1 Tax=Lindgomyces ingoldianus TaxID=673940 RepID=A0ACB6QS83_9PLEO|nr:uncharacterized protein BDR25DRAFT_355998 [Lindgomyces ingoldianus]KAF2469740.1 hypothetical protein BDR25DRAFT_355998 [Lindgomyces ingoldianus]
MLPSPYLPSLQYLFLQLAVFLSYPDRRRITIWTDLSRRVIVIIGDLHPSQQIITSNSEVAVISGTIISLVQTTTLSPSIQNINGLSFTILPNGSTRIGYAQILYPGDPTTNFNRHTISLSPDGADGLRYSIELQVSASTTTGKLLIIGPDGTTSTLQLSFPTPTPTGSVGRGTSSLKTCMWKVRSASSSESAEDTDTITMLPIMGVEMRDEI